MIGINTIYKCVQGEGRLAGTPMVLVRLQGCDVGCSWCDTKETWSLGPKNKTGDIVLAFSTPNLWCELAEKDIADYVMKIRSGVKWVLVTGGEPSSYQLRGLVDEMHKIGMSAALETSGTRPGHVGAGFDWVCVSPKLKSRAPVLPDAIREANEWKFIVETDSDISAIHSFVNEHKPGPKTEISLQPEGLSPLATSLCVKECLETGWRLSIQVHKYIGVA